MQVRFLLVAIACAVCLLALPQPPAPAEPQVSAAQIDFEALRAEARDALETLQRKPQHQAALEVVVEF